MATESADGPDVSVTLPEPLDEWLDERAEELGVERAELLVRLASAYRASAELEGGPLDDRSRDGAAAGPDRERVDGLEERLRELADTHREDLEDVRNRVIQIRDALRDRAAADHDHEEFEELAERVDVLAGDLEDVGADVADLTDRMDQRDERLADVESKLDRLARVVLSIRNGGSGTGPAGEALEHIRETANRSGVDVARCVDCGRSVRIALLSRAACPHCDTEFRDLEEPASALGGWFDLRKPKLVGAEPLALESADE